MDTRLVSDDEQMRLRELISFDILDTEPEEPFDELLRLAALICDCPTALISFIDSERQWCKAKINMHTVEVPRHISFCAQAINQDEVFVVKDTLKDQRFFNHPFVTGEPHIRFYAGAPIHSVNGYNLGVVCVIDYIPRALTKHQKQSLQNIATQIGHLLYLRKEKLTAEKAVDQFKNETIRAEQSIHTLFVKSSFPKLICEKSTLKIIDANEVACSLLGMEKHNLLECRITDLGTGNTQFTIEKLTKLFLAGKPVKKHKIRLHRNNQAILALDLTFSVINHKGDEKILVSVSEPTSRQMLMSQLKLEKTKFEKRVVEAANISRQREKVFFTDALRENINQILACTKLYLSIAKENTSKKEELIEKSHQNISMAIEEIKKLYQPTLLPHEEGYIKESIKQLVINYELLGSFCVNFTLTGDEKSIEGSSRVKIFNLVNFYFDTILKISSLKNISLVIHLADHTIKLIFKTDISFAASKKRVYTSQFKTYINLLEGEAMLQEQNGKCTILYIEIPNKTAITMPSEKAEGAADIPTKLTALREML